MLLAIRNVLSANQLKVIRKLLEGGDFVNGKLSAGKEAAKVKNNTELSQESPLHSQLNQMLMPSLLKNKEFQSFAFPLKIATPLYARYGKGMEYGFHVDDPIMGPMNGRYRSDISATIFLNDDYQGGELTIKNTFGEQNIRLNAGDVIVYPSTSLHKVEEVTQGERLVAVIWAQSTVKDPQKRELIYELGLARDTLIDNHVDAEETSQVSNVYANLLRRWSEV